jgi:hypothetical protein
LKVRGGSFSFTEKTPTPSPEKEDKEDNPDRASRLRTYPILLSIVHYFQNELCATGSGTSYEKGERKNKTGEKNIS